MQIEMHNPLKQATLTRSGTKLIVLLAGLISLLITLLAGKADLLIFSLSGTGIVFLELLFQFRNRGIPNPYIMMLFSPLLLIHYSTIGDFNVRITCFLLLIYLINMATNRPVSIKENLFPPLRNMTAWILAFSIFSTASTIVFLQGVHLSGDEPHYLMVTQSIIEDGDFNLENNFKNKSYYAYLPVDIQFHGKIHNGRYVSYHMPGMSFLLLPFYALFMLLGGAVAPALYFRLVASLINSFFALALYGVLKIQFPGKRITGIWILFLCLFPLIFHSIHLYPELPAAALMMGAFIFSRGQKERYWLSGLLLSLVAWFHVKYYPSMIILALFIVFRILKEKKFKQALLFFLFPLLNFILLMIFCRTLYDTFNPANIFPGNNYFAIPLLLRIKVLLAYFLDQRDGLLFYSPLLFLWLLGFKKKLKNGPILIWIGLSYVLFHAFTTVRGAYSPAGRPLVFISWILLVLVANFYFEAGRDQFRTGFRMLAGLSFFILFWLFYYPFFIYQPVFAQTLQRASGLLLFLGSNIIKLWKLFPSFITHPENTHPANYLWLGGLIFLTLLYYLKDRPLSPQLKNPLIIRFVFFLPGLYLLCLYPHVHLIPENQFLRDGVHFFNNSRNFRYLEDRRGFNILAGQTYKIFLVPGTGSRPLRFILDNANRIDVTVFNKTSRLFRSKKQNIQEFSLDLSRLKALTIGKKTVIPLEIRTRTREKQAFLFMQIKSASF